MVTSIFECNFQAFHFSIELVCFIVLIFIKAKVSGLKYAGVILQYVFSDKLYILRI